MEKHLYTCQFCQKEFVPIRRNIQKFCSATCRSKHHFHKNKVVEKKDAMDKSFQEKFEDLSKKKTKANQMNLADIGNAAAGVLIIKLLEKLLTKVENKSATKGDIQEIKELINQRYFQIHNMERRYDGCLPYFDMATSSLVYFEDPNYINTTNFIP